MKMSKMDMINEGMEDWMEIQEIRAIVKDAAREHREIGSTNPAIIKEAKRRAKAIGLSYWPALVREWSSQSIDVKAYIRADEIVSTKNGSSYGKAMPDGTYSKGGWDSHNRYGISPSFVATAWFAAGCKLGDKFDIQIRTHVVAKKYMSIRQTADYCRGRMWLKHRNMEWLFSTKATVAIGRLSPEFRVLATQDLYRKESVYRIADLRWDVVKGGQEFLARFVGMDRLYARAILGLGFGTDKGCESCDQVPTGIGNASALVGVEGNKETLDALRVFMCEHGFEIEHSDSYATMVSRLIYASRGKYMYHPTVYEFLGNSIYRDRQGLANTLTTSSSEWMHVNDQRGLYCEIFNAVVNSPGADIDHLMACANGLSMIGDSRNGLSMEDMTIGATALFVEAYRLDPQLVHGFKAHVSGTYGAYSRQVSVETCAPVIEAIALYREGKIRKALTHECMPKFVIINKDFGFNLSSSDQTLFGSVNAKAINAVAKAHGWEMLRRYATDTISLTNALGMEAVGAITYYLDDSLIAVFGPREETVHSFVNLYMPNFVANPLSQQWNQFFKKNHRLLRYAGHITAETAIPVSVEAFVKEMSKHKYRRGSEASLELVDLAVRLEMSNSTFERYLDYIKRTPTKTHEMLPFVRIDGAEHEKMGSEYVLEKMHFDDISQLSIGEETSCCQHLGGVGAASAKHSYEEPSSATYVLRKNGNVVAEAWVWRNDEDGVVIDSIEGRSSVSKEVAAHAFYQMAVALIGKLCIKKVFISTTSYGLTRDVKRVIPHKDKMHQTRMIESCGYMDGRNHHLWVSAKMLKAENCDCSEE